MAHPLLRILNFAGLAVVIMGFRAERGYVGGTDNERKRIDQDTEVNP